MSVDGIDSRTSTDPGRITTHRGLRITDPTRTFLDLAADLDLVDLVVLGDSLCRAGRLTPDQLVAAVRTARAAPAPGEAARRSLGA